MALADVPLGRRWVGEGRARWSLGRGGDWKMDSRRMALEARRSLPVRARAQQPSLNRLRPEGLADGEARLHHNSERAGLLRMSDFMQILGETSQPFCRVGGRGPEGRPLQGSFMSFSR